MELITNTDHQHESHGQVTIEGIYREHGVYDVDGETGHIPGGWVIRFSTVDGDTHTEPVGEFIDAVS